MNWSKIKTVLICLFFMINVFLAAMNFIRWKDEQKISDKAVINVIKVLENYGIKTESELISRDVPELGSLVVKNAVGNEAAFLGGILGKNYIKEENIFYSGEKSVTINGNRFIIKDKVAITSSEDAEKWLMENGIDVSGMTKAKYMGNFVYRTVYEGYEIFESGVTVRFDGEYTVAEGMIFRPISEESGVIEVRRITSVLPRLIKDGCRNSEIVEISSGYMCDPLLEPGFAEATAGPVYRIITSEGKEYYYNAGL